MPSVISPNNETYELRNGVGRVCVCRQYLVRPGLTLRHNQRLTQRA